jgi:CubicO group peptidase (beta-lactamase class C family)
VRRNKKPMAALLLALAMAMPGWRAAHAQPGEMPRATPGSVGLQADKLEVLARRLDKEVEARQLAGAVLLVARQGKVAFTHTVGSLDAAAGKPMTEDAIFRIYSMTKPVTVAAALALVDDGKLGLDVPVATYLPEWAAMRVAGTAAPAARAMTVRDLMRHTAGLDYGHVAPDSERARLLQEAYRRSRPDMTNTELAQMLSQLPLAAEPGTVWNYGNGLEVLGRVVEVVSGKPLGAFMAERLFAPLDMRDTAFFWTDEARRSRMAEPIAGDHLLFGRPMFDPRVPRRAELGGEGLVSTARDYARFLQMLINGGELQGRRVLSAASVAEMTRDQLAGIERGSAYTPSALYTFGLGFAVRTAGRDVLPAGEPGDYAWGGAGGTYFWGDPQNQMLVVLMVQAPRVGRSLRPVLRQAVYDALQR